MDRATIRQHPERSVPDLAPEFLSEGSVAHVGFCEGTQPFVIPLAYHYDPEIPRSIFLHGSTGSRMIQTLSTGVPVCVTVTMVDGLVYSRDAKYHSMNYRSVVCFGHARKVVDADVKRRIFEGMIRRYFPGRTEGVDYAGPSEGHLRATDMVEVVIEEWSAKTREGGPRGPRDAVRDASGTQGVVAPL